MEASGLAVSPVVATYGAKDLEELTSDVETLNASTTMSPLDAPEQLLLDEVAELPGGYRLTTVVLRQLCQTLSAGLGHLLSDVSGRARRKDAPESDYSLATAIAVYNRLVRLRFSRVMGRQFVRNVQTRTIDGLVGPKYQYLSNIEFVRIITEGVTDKPLTFHRGFLHGRQLVLRFVQDDRLYISDPRDPAVFRLGQHFANSEVGNAAVRAAPLLAKQDGTAALGPYVGRLAHAGRDFRAKLGKLLGSLPASMPSTDELMKRFDIIRTRPLLYGDCTSANFAKARTRIARRLESRGVPRQLSERLTIRAFFGSILSTIPDIENTANSSMALADRSAYDVFTALVHYPTRTSISHRERIEQLAYSLLIGRFEL